MEKEKGGERREGKERGFHFTYGRLQRFSTCGSRRDPKKWVAKHLSEWVVGAPTMLVGVRNDLGGGALIMRKGWEPLFCTRAVYTPHLVEDSSGGRRKRGRRRRRRRRRRGRRSVTDTLEMPNECNYAQRGRVPSEKWSAEQNRDDMQNFLLYRTAKFKFFPPHLP